MIDILSAALITRLEMQAEHLPPEHDRAGTCLAALLIVFTIGLVLASG